VRCHRFRTRTKDCGQQATASPPRQCAWLARRQTSTTNEGRGAGTEVTPLCTPVELRPCGSGQETKVKDAKGTSFARCWLQGTNFQPFDFSPIAKFACARYPGFAEPELLAFTSQTKAGC